MDMGIAERYRPIVDEWTAFVDSAARPLPTCFWHQRLRVSEEELLGRLRRRGMVPEPVGWLAGAFRLPAESPELGGSVDWLAGLLQVQEEIALLPVRVLDPRPGERILDLCAAPGNKTVQAAVAMGDAGSVLAVDVDERRLGVLHRTVERLALTSVASVAWDGSSLPKDVGLFDGILADVPCSCEGTCRKHPDVLRRAARKAPGWRSGAQKALLRKAIQLSRPDGRIVYSTCTFAPEENEAVLEAMLREIDQLPDVELEVERFDVPGLRSTPGLESFEGRAFDPRVRAGRRYWPHHNDTGGFFVALLRKRGGADSPPAVPPETATPEELSCAEIPERLTERFGLPPDLFENHRLVRLRGHRASLVRRELALPPHPPILKVGLPLVRLDGAVPTPTSAGARWLAPAATRDVVDLRDEETEPFAAGEPFSFDPDRIPGGLRGPLVLVRHRGIGLGKAELRDGTLRPLVPKPWRGAIADLRARRAGA